MNRIGIAYNTDSISLQSHFHNVHEVILVDSGALHITIGSRQMDAVAGSLVFFSNLEAHAVQVTQAPYRRFFLTIPPRLADEALRNPQLASIFKSRPPGFSNVMDVSGDRETIRTLFQRMYEENTHADALSQQSIQSLFQLAITRAYRLRPQAFPMYGRAYSTLVLDVLTYLEAHYAEPLSMAKLAEQFYVSTSHLTHSFTAQVGYSPKQYIMLNRLALAKDLLVGEGLSSGEAATRSGFTDVSNFVRRFRAHYGVSPGQMRQEGRRPL